MTRYMVIFVALLIGSVVGVPPNNYDYGEESCILPGDPNPNVDEDQQCIPSFQQLKSQLEDLKWHEQKKIIKDNAINCALEKCTDNCDCGDNSCDSKCYLGCQIGRWQSMVLFGQETPDKYQKEYCETMQYNWLDGLYTCKGGDNCGVCSERWCAQLTVTESINHPSPGQCERRLQNGWNKGKKHELVCTKAVRDSSCNDLLQYNPYCSSDCGFPVECGCGKNKTYIPFMGTSDFEDPNFCSDTRGHLQLRPGACDTQPNPTCDTSDYIQNEADVRILQWEVLRLPQPLCDETCGLQTNRYKWGHCINGDHDEEGGCFAVVDDFGMDVGSCELDSAGAKVFDCAGNDLCCPEPEEYVAPVQKKVIEYKTETVYKTKDYPEDPEDTYPLYDEADPGSASTYTVLSVAGIALAHAML